MKSITILTIFFLFGITVSYGQSAQGLDNGFNGMAFGTPIDSFKDLKLTENYGDTKFYRKETENAQLGASYVTEVDYGFYKGRLYTVVIKTEGGDNSHAVLNTMRQQYGDGERLERKAEKYIWKGNKVAMRYIENDLTSDAVTTIYDMNLQQQRSQEDKGDYKDFGAGN